MALRVEAIAKRDVSHLAVVGVGGQPAALLLMSVIDAIGRPQLDDAEGDARVGPSLLALSSQGDALQAHQAQRWVVAPFVGVAPAGVDQVATREEQLLKLLEASVGDQDWTLAHGPGSTSAAGCPAMLGRERNI